MAVTNNMHNFITLIKRLEAATSRLEDIATSVDGTSSSQLATVSQLSVPSSLGTAQSATPIATPASPPAPPPEPLPRSIEDFDKLLENEVATFTKASSKIGGLVEEQAQAVQKAFEAERTFLLVSTKAKKPDQPPPELMADIHRYSSSVDDLKEANRPSPYFTHLSAVSEGILALGWIFDTRPVDFVTGTLGGAQYYGNKILKEYKEKDKSHVEYMQAYYKIFRSLAEYVKEHYKTGLTWNQSSGIDALEALKEVQSGQTGSKAAPATGGAPPPPPPPPPLPTFEQLNAPVPPLPAPSAGGANGGDMSAMFNQLNQGSSVTSGLKKVDKSQMTHKNPSLRAAGTVPERSSSQNSTGSAIRGKSPMPARKPEALRTKKPSRKELDGTKWIVENFENTGNEIIEITPELNHSILISRCTKCIIKVNGKANAISIDNCNGLSILVESLVSSLDVIKSPKFAVQVDGVLPTILLDQVDGGQIYLGEKSVKTPPEILTSKCSAINIVLPPKGDEDSKEEPLPEQLRTYLKDGKLYTEIVEHAG